MVPPIEVPKLEQVLDDPSLATQLPRLVATIARQVREALVELGLPTVTLDPYMPLKALAAYAQVSERQLRRWLDDPVDPLPSYRNGKIVLVRVSEFDRWFARYRRVSPDRAPIERVIRSVREARR